ncbi:MipA/OmpV family protein [Insolitispirillum peregrinum]|uniref:MipA/OmpV family protein n=1 Tax=Insolitispirillum peregrinum TaxID=80876 RepID=UPI00360ED715
MSTVKASLSGTLLVLVAGCLPGHSAQAEEPPWSRPPAWLSAPQQATARPVSPEVAAVGLGAGSPRTNGTTSTGSDLIVGAASYTPPVPEYTGPTQHQAAYPAPLPTYSQGLPASSSQILQNQPAVASYTAPAIQPAPQIAAVAPATVVAPVPPPSAPQGKPLWEVGVIAGAAYTPDYPAADQNHGHYLPLPLVQYRGDIVRSDEKGLVRGRIFHTRDAELDVSLNGSFPTSSDDNKARVGMPDLDWMGEIGPRLQWTVARAARLAKVDVEIPVRAAFSTDFHSDFSYRGLVTEPEIAYQNSSFMDSGVALKVGLGTVFATEQLQDYFYQVDNRYATSGRPAYNADAGYMGTRLDLTMASELTPWVGVIGKFRTDFHQGAANEDSPLFKDDVSYTVGLALTMKLAKSKTQVNEAQ